MKISKKDYKWVIVYLFEAFNVGLWDMDYLIKSFWSLNGWVYSINPFIDLKPS
jgi:hypothetical protein